VPIASAGGRVKNYDGLRPGRGKAPWNALTMEVFDPFGNRLELMELRSAA
jgi:hypothetical protein